MLSSSVVRIRCPVEEIGRNSVSPSTTPRISAPIGVTAGPVPRTRGRRGSSTGQSSRLVLARSSFGLPYPLPPQLLPHGPPQPPAPPPPPNPPRTPPPRRARGRTSGSRR